MERAAASLNPVNEAKVRPRKGGDAAKREARKWFWERTAIAATQAAMGLAEVSCQEAAEMGAKCADALLTELCKRWDA